jgi:hypothetical protein
MFNHEKHYFVPCIYFFTLSNVKESDVPLEIIFAIHRFIYVLNRFDVECFMSCRWAKLIINALLLHTISIMSSDNSS